MNQQPYILIVDDLEENLFFLETVLKRIQVTVISALSGYEALEKIKGIDLALAIIDVRMPGMNGYELALKLNEERSTEKVPIIFLTANYFSEVELSRGYKSGAVDYIFKPFDRHILMSKIDVFIDLYNQKHTIISNIRALKSQADELSNVNDALRKSEEKYKSYIDNAPDGVFISDENGKYIEVNKAACVITGYSKEELLNLSLPDVLTEESKVTILNQLKQIGEEGTLKVDQKYRHKSGEKRWINLEAVKLSQKRFLGFIKDITEKKKAEEALSASEANLAKAQSVAHIGSWEWDLKTDTVSMSKEMYRVFELNPETFDGDINSIASVIHPEDIQLFKKNITKNTLQDDLSPVEYRIVHPNGTIRNIYEEGSIETDAAGNPIKKVSTAQDITERKKIEEELRSSLEQLHLQAEYIEKVRDDERVAISRELHDDLGQALTAVKIDLGSIRQSVSDQEIIVKLSKVSALVTDTIKTVQRLTSQLRPEIIDDLGLEAAIEWYSTEFARRNQVEVLLDLDQELSFSHKASHIIFRIMQESLTNIARHSKATQVDISLSKLADKIQLSIADNGIGITEPSITSGKSFGLISMKERAASLGGSLEIIPETKYGTTIRLTFPVNTE